MPAEKGCAPGETGAEGDDEDEVAVLDLAVCPGFFKRKRNRGRRRVAVALEVRGEAVHAHVELARDGFQDTAVRLVRDEPRDLFRFHVALGEDAFAGFRHHAHGVAEDFLAVHPQEMLAVAQGVGGRGGRGASADAM